MERNIVSDPLLGCFLENRLVTCVGQTARNLIVEAASLIKVSAPLDRKFVLNPGAVCLMSAGLNRRLILAEIFLFLFWN